jgi:hypothetical protein
MIFDHHKCATRNFFFLFFLFVFFFFLFGSVEIELPLALDELPLALDELPLALSLRLRIIYDRRITQQSSSNALY